MYTLPKGLLTASECKCPNCGSETYEDGKYHVNKTKYPQYFNYGKGFNGEYNYSIWTELHCCKKCKKQFLIDNGADS